MAGEGNYWNYSWPSQENITQLRNKLGEVVCHDPNYLPVFNEIKPHPDFTRHKQSSIYLGGLLIKSKILGHGEHGVKLLQECDSKDQQLVAVFSIMFKEQRNGGTMPNWYQPVSDHFWTKRDAEETLPYQELTYKQEATDKDEDKIWILKGKPGEANAADVIYAPTADEGFNMDHTKLSKVLDLIDNYMDPNHEVNRGKILPGKTPTVYIHCNIGVGRSATVLAMYDVVKRGMRMIPALTHLKSNRTQVKPNSQQRQFMKDYLCAIDLEDRTPSIFEPDPFDQWGEYLKLRLTQAACAFKNVFYTLPVDLGTSLAQSAGYLPSYESNEPRMIEMTDFGPTSTSTSTQTTQTSSSTTAVSNNLLVEEDEEERMRNQNRHMRNFMPG